MERWENQRNTEAKILAFLNQNNQKAFNLIEIMSGLGYITELKDLWSFLGGMAQYWIFQNAIEQLMKEGKVTARIIEEANKQETYYKAVEKASGKIEFLR